jgi:hypothetical protein
MNSRNTAERVAIVETKLDGVIERLDKSETRWADLSEKMDRLLIGQQEGKADRADIKKRLELIEPDAKTIRDAKTVLKYGSWGVGVLATVGGAILAAKGWIVVNWHYLTGGR